MIAAATGDRQIATVPERDNRWRRTVLLGALVIVALSLSLISAPTLLLVLFALPVLVLVPGYLGATLVLGIRGGSTSLSAASITADDTETDDETAVSVDSTVRIVLPALIGLLLLLATVLLVAVVGAGITTTSIAIALGGITLVLLLTVQFRQSRPGRQQELAASAPTPMDWRLLARRGGLVMVACAVVIGGVVGARAMQPAAVDNYTQISFSNRSIGEAAPLSAAPGAQVSIPWTLDSFAYTLPDADPTVDLTIGDSTARDLVVNQSVPVPADDGMGSTSTQTGNATFTAPTEPGLYRVNLTVTVAGEPAVELTDYLQVG